MSGEEDALPSPNLTVRHEMVGDENMDVGCFAAFAPASSTAVAAAPVSQGGNFSRSFSEASLALSGAFASAFNGTGARRLAPHSQQALEVASLMHRVEAESKKTDTIKVCGVTAIICRLASVGGFLGTK